MSSTPAPVSMETILFRPRFSRWLAGVVSVIGVVMVVWGLIENAGDTWPFIAPVAFAVLWVFMAYWRPSVVVSPGGVQINNVLRTIDLTWPAITRIDTKYALTLITRVGDFAAWAAPAGGRIGHSRAMRNGAGQHLPESTYSGGGYGPGDVLTAASGQAAAIVRARWEELRDAGLLDNPQLESAKPKIRWNTWYLVALAGLLVASVLGLALS